ARPQQARAHAAPDAEGPPGVRQPELGFWRLRSHHRRAVEAPAARRLPPLPSGGGDERHDVLTESAEAFRLQRYSAIQPLPATRTTTVSVSMSRATIGRPPTWTRFSRERHPATFRWSKPPGSSS